MRLDNSIEVRGNVTIQRDGENMENRRNYIREGVRGGADAKI